MELKEGNLWEAHFDDESNLYTAGFFSAMSGSCTLYEINKDLYDKLEDGMDNSVASDIYSSGRRLYMFVNDQCGPAYTVIFDEDYQKLCPWANVPKPKEDNTWPKDMTEAVVSVIGSESEKQALNQTKTDNKEE